MSFARYSEDFLEKLSLEVPLPSGVEVLNPLGDPRAVQYTRAFYHRYYADSSRRILLIGINPGRFGAGVTGIAFTDPIHLEQDCGIDNDLPQKPELSSTFIYHMIEGYGGVPEFYGDFLFTAVSPVGFVRAGKNMNYYDDRELWSSLEPFILRCLRDQVDMGADRRVALSLGQGKNYRYLCEVNERTALFEEVVALPHPRWIMQYRRKRMEEFRDLYVDTLLRWR